MATNPQRQVATAGRSRRLSANKMGANRKNVTAACFACRAKKTKVWFGDEQAAGYETKLTFHSAAVVSHANNVSNAKALEST